MLEATILIPNDKNVNLLGLEKNWYLNARMPQRRPDFQMTNQDLQLHNKDKTTRKAASYITSAHQGNKHRRNHHTRAKN